MVRPVLFTGFSFMIAKHTLLPSIALAAATLAMSQTHSHTRWDPNGLTPPRTNADNIKTGPCGAARTGNPTVLESGATITVEFESTIFHQGDLRIAFSEANDEGFDEHVLVNDIQDFADQRYRSQEITLPDLECEQCTLQLIQVMRDRNPPTNYYSCADITLARSNADDTTPPSGVSNLVALPADGQAMLSWTNPNDNDFAGVLLLQQLTAVTAEPIDGQMYTPGTRVDEAEVIYSGSGDNKTATALPAGATTHFAVFAYDHSFNYSAAVATSVAIPEQAPNFMPSVELRWEQPGNDSDTIDTSDAANAVLVHALVTDENPGDSHNFNWTATDARLADIDDSEEQFTFAPQGLESGAYSIYVTVTDSGEPALSATASLNVELSAQPKGNAGGSLSWLVLLGMGLLWARARRGGGTLA